MPAAARSGDLQGAAIGVDDASDSIRDYLDKLEADPKRLDEIESRLALMERLNGSTVPAWMTCWPSWKMSVPR